MIHTERSTLPHKQVTHWQVVCAQCSEIVCRSHYRGHSCRATRNNRREYLHDHLCSDKCWDQYKQERGLDHE